MPLVNNKVGDLHHVPAGTDLEAPPGDEQALVGSLMKVVACFRLMASCVGGSTDTLQLRDELRQMREKAQRLSMACCQRLTSRLRDKSLPVEDRREMELLWVAFSSGLELLHADLCKVFAVANIFRLANTDALVQTGIQGGGSEVAARALSLPDLHAAGGTGPALLESLEAQESGAMEQEIQRVDRMIEDMELKVNVLRWTVEPRGVGGSPEASDPPSGSDSVSVALLSLQEEGQEGREDSPRRHAVFLALVLCSAALVYDLTAGVPKAGGRRLLFDTHAMVRLLEDKGFSTQQAEVVVSVLVKTTHSNMDAIYSDMATKVQQEIMLQRVMSQIAAVKKDMIILEKSEFSMLLTENEKVKIHLLQLKGQLADLMNKVRSDTLLDMSIEKSRVKEMKAMYERKLLETRTDIMEMNAEHDCHLTQTNMKIDTEVAGLKTMLESHKLDTIKYLAGSVFTCLTVVLGFYRIWM
ncbi:hypothetical protein NHX12_021508 [Muraenolepis orangiensis]|uniref:Mitochondrial calcium uniporter regulator 1 n=1 Tax=Muraenolepis orangiensis TaxID=630683 RepID=A0A9Q0ETV4_9TELE|nr:hypothetical protein NHX12_021508 [Muraenolepis orangiensis]